MTITPDILEVKNSPLKRNDFLAAHKPFVAKIASKHCGRYLAWGQDDELSIALIALNQAIDAYKAEANVPFLAFARRVIERRLTDYFRKESKGTQYAVSLTEGEDGFLPGEAARAWEDYVENALRQERIEEIQAFAKLLSKYKVSFTDLEAHCPKHRDSRELLTKTAYLLVQNPTLLKSFLTKKQVPIKELAKLSGLSPKTLEKSRKYLVATALLLHLKDEFLHLREFINIPKEGGPEVGKNQRLSTGS